MRNTISRGSAAVVIRYAAVAVVLLAFSVAIGCGGAGKEAAATVTVTVQAPPETVEIEDAETTLTTEDVGTEDASAGEDQAAVVAATKTGFGQDDEEVGYGMILRNTSKTEDALDVTVTVNVLDRQGNILSTESESVNVIPAGEVFYLGGATYVAGGETAHKIDPVVSVGSSEPASYPLPKVTRVRIIRDEYLGVEVRGEIENTLREPLSSFAKIGIVIFDSKGNVVGGGFTFPDGEVPPGRRVAFRAGNGVSATSPSRAHFARASIDNEVS